MTDVTRFQRSKPSWLATANFNRSSMFSFWLLVGLLAHSAPLPVLGGCRIGTRWPRRDFAVDIQLPVPVTLRIGLKIDVSSAACEDAIFTGLFASHWGTLA